MVMASAVALPLQQLVLCSPLMFKYKETSFWGDYVALLLVLFGFTVYQYSKDGRISRGDVAVGNVNSVGRGSNISGIQKDEVQNMATMS